MDILSLQFYLFVAASVFLYYLCAPRMRWLIVLTSNALFFLSNSTPAAFLILVGMTLLTWVSTFSLFRIKSARTRKLLVGCTIVILIACLVYFKELVFFVNIDGWLDRHFHFSLGLQLPAMAAPLGISYYTLILIGYLLDSSWEVITVEKNPLRLLTFTSFFPQMLSGPFTRYADVQDTLLGTVKFRIGNFYDAVVRLAWGIFKVSVLSSRLGTVVNTIFSTQTLPVEQNPYTGFYVIIGAILYVLYVYMNFSGSMDMLIAIAQFFGVKLPENFQQPFSATNLSEVWRRWHMTLGFWLKDYVLYPFLKSAPVAQTTRFLKKHFGKKASRNIPTYLGMFLTWSCVGLWHGGTWNFIFGSGLFFFIMILGGILLEPFFQKLIMWFHINTACYSWKVFQRMRTFLLFAFSVSFGRAISLKTGLSMWATALSHLEFKALFNGSFLNMGITAEDWLIIGVGLALVTLISHLQLLFGSFRDLLRKQNIVCQVVIVGGLILATVVIGGMNHKIDFIYGNF